MRTLELNSFLVLWFIYTLEGYTFLPTSSENSSVGYEIQFNFFHLLKTATEETSGGCCNHREIGRKVIQIRWSAKQKRIILKSYAGRKWRFSGQNILFSSLGEKYLILEGVGPES